jgi:hypothetical protein
MRGADNFIEKSTRKICNKLISNVRNIKDKNVNFGIYMNGLEKSVRYNKISE